MFRWICKTIFHLIGWRVEGHYPSDIKRKVLIVAPHTSSWDVPLGLLVKVWLDMDLQFYVKEEMFKGILGPVLRAFSAVPLDRSGNTNFVQSVVRDIRQSDSRTILITPEGTRRKVDKFRTGFYHIADGAGVPIVPISFDAGRKVVKFHELIYTHGDAEREIPQIEQIFRGIQGLKAEYSMDKKIAENV